MKTATIIFPDQLFKNHPGQKMDGRDEEKQRWIRIYRKSGKPCPVCGTAIQFFRQAGRITYACPKCQH